jgi:hypothetical protein
MPQTAFLWQYLQFREFPWHNGLVLKGSEIERDLRRWLEEEPARNPDINTELLEVRISGAVFLCAFKQPFPQTQAKHLVSADLAQIFRKDPRKFEQLSRILNPSRRDMLLPPAEAKTQSNWTHDYANAANLLFQFHLFDLYADVLGYPANPARQDYPKVPAMVELPGNLTKVRTLATASPATQHAFSFSKISRIGPS